MNFFRAIRELAARFSRKSRPAKTAKPKPTVKLHVESLEDRIVPTVNPIGGTISDTITIDTTITTTIHHPPVLAAIADQTSAEGNVVVLPVSATSPDGYALNFSAANLPPGLAMNDPTTGTIGGTVDYSAAEQNGGIYTVSVTATDPFGLSDTKSFAWTVTNTTRPPVLSPIVDQANAEGDVISLQTSATNPEGNLLTYSAANLPNGLEIDDSGKIGGTIDFGDAHQNSGNYTVSVTVSDTVTGLSDIKNFAFAVAATTSFTVNTAADTPLVANGLDANGKVSLRSAIEQANQLPLDEVITINFDLAAMGAGQITLTKPLEATANIRIVGTGTLPDPTNVAPVTGPLVPAISLSSIKGGLVFAEGSDSSIEYLAFKNFDDAGADDASEPIWNSGTLTIAACVFQDNKTFASGAGVLNDGTLTVTDSTFANNQAVDGGAIDNNGTLYITGSTFTLNSAQQDGGAIMCRPNSTTQISSSTFKENSVPLGNQKGGALSILAGATVIAENTAFDSNQGGLGGAIYSSGGIFQMTGGEFYANQGSDGGAIYDSTGQRLWLTNVTVTSNTATTGGAIYAKNTVDGGLSGCTFSDNTDAAGGPNVAYWGILNGDATIVLSLDNVQGTTVADWLYLGL